jgi:curli production assembly/transport component CsgG
MIKIITILTLVALLSGCASYSSVKDKITGKQFDQPAVDVSQFVKQNSVKPPAGGPIVIAVYGFKDLTGQRKTSPTIASFSTAVTQGPEGYLIKALQDAGDQKWFRVVERGGLENLIRERQMIRQMREQYEGRDAKPLPPLVFAGVIVEGGILGYDSNTATGGVGVSVFGIGASTQYQRDTVRINLRTVSVSSGEVLTSVTVSKTILSYMDRFTGIRFINDGTRNIETELGGSVNESINRATDLAIQAAVVETIKEGVRKGHWNYKEEKVAQPNSDNKGDQATKK